MGTKKGLPQEIIDKLDIRTKEKTKLPIVTIIVEGHQARIPIPNDIRLEMELDVGKKYLCEMEYNKAKKEIICRLL